MRLFKERRHFCRRARLSHPSLGQIPSATRVSPLLARTAFNRSNLGNGMIKKAIADEWPENARYSAAPIREYILAGKIARVRTYPRAVRPWPAWCASQGRQNHP